MATKSLLRACTAVIDTKAAKASNDYTIPAMVSTASVDSYGEIILPSAFTRDLERYLSNPVLCWGHPLSAMCETPGPESLLGRAESVRVRTEKDGNDRGGLDCVFRYAVNENPDALLCYNLVKGGYLKAYSIGAYCMEWVTVEDKGSEAFELLPEFARLALLMGEANCIHTRMQLIEISQVLVGACPEALVAEGLFRAVEDGVVPREFAVRALGPTLISDLSRRIYIRGSSLSEMAEAKELATDFADLTRTPKAGRLQKVCARVQAIEDAVHAKLDTLQASIEVLALEVKAIQASFAPVLLEQRELAPGEMLEAWSASPEALGAVETAAPYDPLDDLT